MKWDNLAKNKCPQCNKDLTKAKIISIVTNPQVKKREVLVCKCGFAISTKKMTKIIINILENK